ncbi:MAG: oligosaccharide flippase family protein, partial [Longispora sp.]|nr:oligosaccharide flippase family protein [Longispora sp. (in: high G+C Gram-positive bacteria)]
MHSEANWRRRRQSQSAGSARAVSCEVEPTGDLSIVPLRYLQAEGQHARPAGIIHNVAWSFIGTVVFSVAQWLVILILARLGNSTMVGQYALGFAISTPVVLLASLSLRTVQVTESRRQFSFKDYLVLRLICMIVAFCIIVSISTFCSPQNAVVLILIGLAKIFNNIGDIFFGLFQRHERMRNIALPLIINGVITVLATLVLLELTKSIVGAAMGSVIGSALGVIICCVLAAKLLRDYPETIVRSDSLHNGGVPDQAHRKIRSFAQLALVALPLGFASVMTSLIAYLPQYFVGHHLGMAALGIFAALGYIIPAVNTVFTSVVQTMLPRMTRLYASGEGLVLGSLTVQLVLGSLGLGAAGTAVVAVLGKDALQLTYGKIYADYAGVLTVL